jgi:hypothetical protein
MRGQGVATPLWEEEVLTGFRAFFAPSARVGVVLHRRIGEPVAVGEDLLDFVNGLPSVAGGTAGPERRGGLEVL